MVKAALGHCKYDFAGNKRAGLSVSSLACLIEIKEAQKKPRMAETGALGATCRA